MCSLAENTINEWFLSLTSGGISVIGLGIIISRKYTRGLTSIRYYISI